MSIFDDREYKQIVLQGLAGRPKGGHGQFLKLAEFMGVHTSFVSQVFKGEKDLSSEQACLVAEFLNFNELEQEYFITLVQHQRAGNPSLKKFTGKRLDGLRSRSRDLSERVKNLQKLSEEDRATYYSFWYYSGIALLTSLKEINSIDEIARYLNLPPALVRKVLDFLIEKGFCVQNEKSLAIGPQDVYIEPQSPLALRHHLNWRQKAMEQIPKMGEEDFAFTSPMTVSRNDFIKVRDVLSRAVDEIFANYGLRDEEAFACLNIDWLKLEPLRDR